MHVGVVEHHDGKSIGGFLAYKPFKRFDDTPGGHRVSGGVGDQLPGSTDEYCFRLCE